VSNPDEVLARITAPHFTAGIIIRDGAVTDAPPILRYMLGWPPQRVLAYCERKGWTVRRV
jgi:hypothetical protein